jgi:hypothetical protein
MGKQSFPGPLCRIAEGGPHLVRCPETTKGATRGTRDATFAAARMDIFKVPRIVSHASLA